MMNSLGDLLMKAVEVYLDDFIVFGHYSKPRKVPVRPAEGGVRRSHY
jgi:hypothetical protein